eukprot:jgi/Psemu1/26361/gm1.26361_g
MYPTSLLLTVLCMFTVGSLASIPTSPRNVNDLSRWANEQGVVMHDSLRWKNDDDDNDDNIGVELTQSVEPGTVLLKVPRSIVFDALRIRDELEKESPEQIQKALEHLRQSGFDQHVEGFFIFLKVLKCCQEGESSLWSPYIQSLPRHFVEFTSPEKSCLPYYAKYVADYQEEKLKAFCDAAVVSGLVDGSAESSESEEARFAFCAVSSRFWKTSSTEAGTAAMMKGTAGTQEEDATSELVPVGDMFNHREPSNVAITHEGDYVNFVYKGNVGADGEEENNDLYITYGQPSNPHRFLGIFGFVPVSDMPNVWSHLVYVDNPFTDDVEKMVFRVSDGDIPKHVWDAVLYALLEPKHPPNEPPEFTDEQHVKYRTYTADILQGHIKTQLEELAALRNRIKMLEALGTSPNIGLIRLHNEFLTDVFEKASKQVAGYLEGGE